MFLSPWHTILAIYSWSYDTSLVLSDLPNITRLISLHYIPTPLLFPFSNCIWKLSFRHYITFQAINLQSYFKMACVKSVLWPALVSNVVDVSLSGGRLRYWTACNNVKRHCTVPYCGKGSQFTEPPRFQNAPIALCGTAPYISCLIYLFWPVISGWKRNLPHDDL